MLGLRSVLRAWRRCPQRAAMSEMPKVDDDGAAGAEVAAGVVPVPNWDRIMSCCSDEEERKAVMALRKHAHALDDAIRDAERPVPSIDWAQWEQKIVDKDLVNLFKDAYTKNTVEHFDTIDPAANDQWQAEHMKTLDEQLKSIESQVSYHQAEIDKIEVIKASLPTATVQSELQRNPQLADKIKKEIDSDNWHF